VTAPVSPSRPVVAEPAQLVQEPSPPVPAPTPEVAADAPPAHPLSEAAMIDAWPEILEAIGEKKRGVWSALVGTEVMGLEEDVVTIGFPSLTSAELLKKPQGPGLAANAELVREAILATTGHRVRFKVQELPTTEPTPGEALAVEEVAPASEAAGSWPTVLPPQAEAASPPEEVEPLVEPEVPTGPVAGELSQVGEAVIREVLGGELISEKRIDEEN